MTELPSLTVQVVELFRGPLSGVRFPDADAERLETSIEAVQAAGDLVVHAEAALEAARDALATKRQALAAETERAIAYARVYAEGRPELRAELEAMTTPAPRTPGKRPPGRPKKSAPRPPERTAAAETETASSAAAE